MTSEETAMMSGRSSGSLLAQILEGQGRSRQTELGRDNSSGRLRRGSHRAAVHAVRDILDVGLELDDGRSKENRLEFIRVSSTTTERFRS